MQTLAQRHRLKALAAKQTAAAHDPHGQTKGSAYELMQAQLHEHLRTLKGIQSVERKIEAKRTMLADYDAYLDGVLQADTGNAAGPSQGVAAPLGGAAPPAQRASVGGNGKQDVVLATTLVWHIDVGNWARALQLARYALAHGIKLPDQYQRDLPTLLADEYSDAAIAGKLAGEEAIGQLTAVGDLVRDLDVPDQARAKLCKAFGWSLMGKTATRDVDVKALPQELCVRALPFLTRAIELFPQIGVKKDVERLQRRIEP